MGIDFLPDKPKFTAAHRTITGDIIRGTLHPGENFCLSVIMPLKLGSMQIR